ncbi:MAG: Rrf2 family transcriptional regulator [Kofleriaceae bacterium]|jgi:Rrf2 family protein|nr:Rrf2 family transcriptional regulator [Kofleriaceae bacterium]MBP9166175.1 Rrf2 family transcriptional regulator [Kofleriaceae bacterium]MBP9857005.1 Rrf2 family transcriptional regulator [Kofleriaceae bacterium]
MSNSRFAVATHVLTSLALVAEDDPAARLTSEALAASINTSPVVIRRIIGRLRAAGLVVAQTGRGGGAALARPASKISLLDVHRAVDEPVLFALNPNQPNPQCAVSCRMKDVLGPAFAAAERAARAQLARVRLSSLVAALRAPRA